MKRLLGNAGGEAGGWRREVARSRGDLDLAFRKTLQIDSSDFSVEVPRQLAADRKFSFASLNLVPGFFSEQAGKLNLDTAEELNKDVELYLTVSARRLLNKGLESGCVFNNPEGLQERREWVNAFNKKFIESKPPHLLNPPFVIDWWDDRHSAMSLEDFLQMLQPMAVLYYGGSLHTSGLKDEGLRNLSDKLPSLELNPYVVPTGQQTHTAVKDHLVLRLHLAPLTRLVCSSDKELQELGFETGTLGKRGQSNKFIIENNTKHWKTLWATAPPEAELVSAEKRRFLKDHHTFYPSHHKDDFIFNRSYFFVKERDWRKFDQLFPKISDMVDSYARYTNLAFALKFNTVTSTCYLEMPQDVEAKVYFPPILSWKLGFGYLGELGQGAKAKTIKEEPEVTTVENKCKALVYDTGVVLCTPAKESSGGALMNPENCLGSLYPHYSGTLKLDLSAGLPNSFGLEDLRFGSGPTAQATFRLHRFLSDDDLVPLKWTVPAYVFGTLRASSDA